MISIGKGDIPSCFQHATGAFSNLTGGGLRRCIMLELSNLACEGYWRSAWVELGSLPTSRSREVYRLGTLVRIGRAFGFGCDRTLDTRIMG